MLPDISTPEELNAFLALHADRKKAAFSASLIPNLTRPILGVRIPDLRRLARRMANDDAAYALDYLLTDHTHEEVMLKGLVTGYAKQPFDVWLRRVESFVPLIDNWAVCDTVCSTFTLIRRYRNEGWDFLKPFLVSKEEFRQRFAVVMLMDHYLTEAYFEQTLTVLKRLQPHGYYAVMAVGWTLQVAFVKHPEAVFPLLSDTNLSAECRRTARKKILESLRTPAEWRIKVKALRI